LVAVAASAGQLLFHWRHSFGLSFAPSRSDHGPIPAHQQIVSIVQSTERCASHSRIVLIFKDLFFRAAPRKWLPGVDSFPLSGNYF
jgi:hypothetical protein